MLGDELANAIGLCRESGLRSPTTAGWGQRSRLTVALQESAHERRADSESFGHLGSGFASLTSLEDADAEIVGNRCHAAVRGMSSGLPGTSVYHPLPKCEVGSSNDGESDETWLVVHVIVNASRAKVLDVHNRFVDAWVDVASPTAQHRIHFTYSAR